MMPAPLAEVVSDFQEVEGQDKLRLLLEFATKGYETMLAATEELKSMVDAPKKTQTGMPEQNPVSKGKRT